MPPASPPVQVDRTDAVAVIRMQGRHGNALNEDLLNALQQAFSAAAADPEIRAVLLTSGGKLFSPGLDLQELQGLERPAMDRFMGLFTETILAVYSHPQPVLAAASGHAVAGGCVLALACDLRYLQAGARIGLNEVKVGVPLPFAVAQLLRETVHRPALTEIALLGRNFSDQEAVDVGLAHGILPPDRFHEACLEKARQFCSRDREALRRTKAYLQHAAVERLRAHDADRRGEFLDCWFSAPTRRRVGDVVQGLQKRR